jgi:transposase
MNIAITRKPYLTDLSDSQWELLQPLLKLPTGRVPKTTDLREVVNAIFDFFLQEGKSQTYLLTSYRKTAKTIIQGMQD